MQSDSKPTVADLEALADKAATLLRDAEVFAQDPYYDGEDLSWLAPYATALRAGADAMLAVERVRALSLNIRNRTGIAEFLRTIISNEIFSALSPEEHDEIQHQAATYAEHLGGRGECGWGAVLAMPRLSERLRAAISHLTPLHRSHPQFTAIADELAALEDEAAAMNAAGDCFDCSVCAKLGGTNK